MRLLHVLAHTAAALTCYSCSTPGGPPLPEVAEEINATLESPTEYLLGPGDTHMAHQTDEYCEVARLPDAVAMFKAIVQDWYAHDAGGGPLAREE